MKRLIYSLVILALFAATQIAAVDVRASHVQEVTQQTPQITSARVKGKKLIVTGENFSPDATIIVEGEAVGTRSDPDNPTGTLIAKKGAKHIPPETMASIAVQNNTGVMSDPFDVFAGLVITFEDDSQVFGLAVGEKFELALKKDSYLWDAPQFDPKVIAKLSVDPAPPNSQGIFQAVNPGATRLTSVGNLPCFFTNPPCLAPSLSFGVTLEVK